MPGLSLSIVVPNFNHAKYLPKCLGAIFSQERAPDEVIFVDDASTDDSVDLIVRQQVIHKSLRLIRNEFNKGVIASITRGLNEATCDYVAFAAADDWFLPGFFGRSMELLGRFPGAGLCSALSLQLTDDDDPPRPFPTPVVLGRPGFISPERALQLLMRHDTWFMGNALVLRRDAVLEMGGFRPGLHSFCDGFLYQLLAVKYGACFIPSPLAVWRRRKEGYSATTLADLKQMRAISSEVTDLMTTRYSSLFPPSYVKRWQDRWRYRAISGALGAPSVPDEELQKTWRDMQPFELGLLRLAGNRGGVTRDLAQAYLFARHRGRDLPFAIARRLSWMLGAHRSS